MPKFKKDKKVIRAFGGYPAGAVQQRGAGKGSALPSWSVPFGYPAGAVVGGSRGSSPAPSQPSQAPPSTEDAAMAEYMKLFGSSPVAGQAKVPGPTKKKGTSKSAPISAIVPAISGPVETENEYLQEMMKLAGEQQQPTVAPLPSSAGRVVASAPSPVGRLASMEELGFKKSTAAPAGMSGMLASAEIPKTKAGMKKFMQDYGKFIALGAMAGAGGKGGQIAAPIMAALPGLIEMMKGKKSSKSSDAPKPSVQTGMAHGGSVGKKSSGGDTPKKSEGGAIRKFKGGSMNTKDSMLTPKYKKGGDMPKAKMGKAMGEMPQHKKMAMGKPTPQSTGQKFAKGGAAKYAGGGMCKGYGISKKIRPTGPMN